MQSAGRIQCLVSIGTGIPDLKSFGDNLKEVVDTLKNIATETEETAREFQDNLQYYGLEGRYFRFNVDRGLADVEMDKHDRHSFAVIESLSEDYMDTDVVRKNVERLVNALPSSICR